MVILTVKCYDLIKDYLHPNVNKFINYYRVNNRIELPPFHGCNYKNRNRTRKLVSSKHGEQCIPPIWHRYWKKNIKAKYKTNIGFFYWTRYMTQTSYRFFFKNKGYFVYNYKLKKYEHMKNTPIHDDFKRIQDFKEGALFKKYVTK